MSPIVTILLYAVIPLGVILLFAAIMLRPSGRGGTRWRSGAAWDHEPVWWMGNPRGSGVAAPPETTDDPTLRTARGGARGTW